MANPTGPGLDWRRTCKPALDFPTEGSRFQRMQDGSWEYSRNGSIPDSNRGTLKRYSLVDLCQGETIQDAATAPEHAPVHAPSTVERSYNDEPSHSDRTKPLDKLKNVELASPSSAVGMMPTSPNTILGSDRTTRTSSVFSFSDDEDLYSAEDGEPRHRSQDLVIAGNSFESSEIEHIENLAPQDSITTNSMLRNQELIFPRADSDLESLESVSDSESDIDSWVNEPTVPELEERLRQKTRCMKVLCDMIQTAATDRKSGEVQHMKQLQEMAKSTGELSRKLQEANGKLQELQLKYNQEILAGKTHLTHTVLDDNNKLVPSLESLHEKGLTSLEAGCDRRVLAAETSISRLLKATKCNRILRKRLQSIAENCEDVKRQNDVLFRDNSILQEHVWKLVGNAANVVCYSRVPLEGDDSEISVPLLKERIQSLTQQAVDIAEERKAESEMHERLRGHYFALNAKYTGMLDQPNSLVEAQLRLAFLEKDRIPELSSQVIELEREIRSRDDLHRKEKQKQESRYKGLTLQNNRDKKELDVFRKIKVPALERQVTGLQMRAMSILAQHEQLRGIREVAHKALFMKNQKLSEELEQLRADHQRCAEAQNDLELRNEMQQQLTDLKLAMEDMTKVQKARYHMLDQQMSSFSPGNAQATHPKPDSALQAHQAHQPNHRLAEGIQRQLDLPRDETEIERNNLDREVQFLAHRLAKLQRTADRATTQAAAAHARERALLNLNYRLKEANVKLARSAMSSSVKDGEEEYPGAAPGAWGGGHAERRYLALRASYKRLEGAHEIAQEAHKVLEGRLQEEVERNAGAAQWLGLVES